MIDDPFDDDDREDDWCDECQGRGKVTTADYESYFGASYKTCPKCQRDPCHNEPPCSWKGHRACFENMTKKIDIEFIRGKEKPFCASCEGHWARFGVSVDAAVASCIAAIRRTHPTAKIKLPENK